MKREDVKREGEIGSRLSRFTSSRFG